MWSFFKGLFGQYKGYQRTEPALTMVPEVKAPTIDNLLQIPEIWNCVGKIANTMASLPCDVLKIAENGRTEIDKDCDLFYLLSRKPNKDMTPFDFFRAMTLNYLIYGNAYALISRAGKKVIALTPLNAKQMRVKVENSITYEYYSKDDKIISYSAENILHWKNLGNGIMGMSLADFARSSLTEAASAQTAAIGMFKENGKLTGILTCDNMLTDRQKVEIAEQFSAMRSMGRIPVLPAALRFQPLSATPAEQQLLQTREFIVQQFSSWFGVPQTLIKGEGNNLDDSLNFFYKTTILPICSSFEQAIMTKIACDDSEHVVKFRLSFLNRANDAQRAQLNATYVQNGIKTRNEVRREEGLKDVEGGDTLTAQTNLAPIDQLDVANFNPSQTLQNLLTSAPMKN